MKTFITILLCCCYSWLQAQDTNLYVFYQESSTKKNVIGINKETLKPVIVEKATTDTDTYFDGFIIKPSEDPRYVYLIAAQKNNLYLRRNNGVIEYKDITTDTSNLSYQWEIQYFGLPYVAIVNPLIPKRALHIENQNLIIKEVQSVNWGLTNNSDTKGDAYRFKIKKISNTF
ncbi:RICIN domain-containing protein [Flavobacterium sp.]|uniref:RICIN domain-containing protein n=1 Tax=Flavobacterium sp. TaxID=239 RepID=UPI003D0C8D15